MSWFDTTKIASMATKAMKEAQKTLDTALDIKDEEEAGLAPGPWQAWVSGQWHGEEIKGGLGDSVLPTRASGQSLVPCPPLDYSPVVRLGHL